ncbi:MAG: hypothetical protein GOU97_04335 [Nanoarchaeota archaeon]|nr:hypothetical protein [Nanoarchaeota archaeon]
MKNKKIMTAALMAALILLPMGVMAEETTQDVQVLPGNPLYGFKRVIERIQTWFTLGAEEKARLHLLLAERRLAELKELQEQNKTSFDDELITDYENQMLAMELQINLTNHNITQQLELAIVESTAKHQAVMQRVMEKAPERVQQRLQRVMERQAMNQEKFMQRLMQRVGENPGQNYSLQKGFGKMGVGKGAWKGLNCTEEGNCPLIEE